MFLTFNITCENTLTGFTEPSLRCLEKLSHANLSESKGKSSCTTPIHFSVACLGDHWLKKESLDTQNLYSTLLSHHCAIVVTAQSVNICTLVFKTVSL